MTCHRCDGLMLAEQYDDLRDYGGQAGFTGWRCVNCGAVLDPVILANRDRVGENRAVGMNTDRRFRTMREFSQSVSCHS